MDDFIDDGEGDLDYSSEIKKIFGYDKSRFVDNEKIFNFSLKPFLLLQVSR